MKASVITIGTKHESLGAKKLASWLRSRGWLVDESNRVEPMFHDYDLTCFSVVFSWRLPELVKQVRSVRGEVWIGGPAVTFSDRNRKFVMEKTGVNPTIGIDDRFEGADHDADMTYFSRGCPAYTPACGLCPVPRIEGTTFRFYPNAKTARLLLDNNLSALPGSYQDHIISCYRDWDGKVDANSGFEPHTFADETFERWSVFPLQCWRFGYDDLTERCEALTMLELLRSRGVRSRKIRVYTLLGNEPVADCVNRCDEVIAGGGEPCPQRLRPLDWLGGPLPTRHDWTEQDLIAVQRYYTCPQIWRSVKKRDFYYQSRFPFREIDA